MQNERSCGMLIKKINNTLEKNANNALRSSGLTLAQMSAVVIIKETCDKQISLKELEKTLFVAQSTAAGIVSRLENKGLVTSAVDAEDRRIKLVKLTPEGERYCDIAEKNMAEAEKNILSGLTETEQEIFYSLLRKVSETIK
ncbi:MAG: MarR family winged helix-turn-helix transcriptional regulator [Candidatus Ornithomonoglobus sp.]